MITEIIKYQEIDGKLRRLLAELNGSDARKKATEMQTRLKDGQTRLGELEKNSQKVIENYRRAQAYYGELVAKIEAMSKTVDGANLAKVKELQQANGNFAKMIDRLEKELVKISAQLNSVSNEYSNIIKNAKVAKSNLDSSRTQFADQKAKLEPQIEALKAELASQAKKIDKSVLEKYNAKKESKFPVIVKNVNGTCGGCRMAISAARSRELASSGICECENCGRIIYAEDKK